MLGYLPPTTTGADFDILTALGGLNSLHLLSSPHLPTCLPRLPQLQALRLNDSPGGVAVRHPPAASSPALAELSASLRQLAAAATGQQLRHLVLEFTRQLPPEVALLPLDTLYWSGYRSAPGQPDSQLPGSGPYLSSLRRLALPSAVAASSLAVLGAMPQLGALAILGRTLAKPDVAHEARMVEWAAQQRPTGLRRLAISFAAIRNISSIGTTAGCGPRMGSRCWTAWRGCSCRPGWDWS